MELVKLRVDEIHPYQNNPRYNDDAVLVVEESIEQVGYISPIIVDENKEILCGHTRWKSLDNLGRHEIDCIMVRGLTDEQKRKFRLLDNKTAEIASWDLDKLMGELEDLDFGDFDFFSKEIEKMADKTIAEHADPKEKVIICPRCGKVVVGLVNMEDFED